MDMLPDIVIAQEDLPALSQAINRAIAEGRYVAASGLGNELHRASILPAAQVPADRVVLNAAARYLDEASQAVHEVVVVAGPGSPAAGTVSVLSQIGTALIGLAAGQRMSWIDPKGRRQSIRLLRVRQPRRPAETAAATAAVAAAGGARPVAAEPAG